MSAELLVVVCCSTDARCPLLEIRRTPRGDEVDYATNHSPGMKVAVRRLVGLHVEPVVSRRRTVTLDKVLAWRDVEAACRCGVWVFEPGRLAGALAESLAAGRTRTLRLADDDCELWQ